MIKNSTEFNNLLNDSRIDVFFEHHPPGQGLHTVPVTVNLCRGAKTWHLKHAVNFYFGISTSAAHPRTTASALSVSV